MIATLIIFLHLTGIVSVESASTSLYVAGVLLLIAEFGVISFGLLALNGAIALYAAYTLQTGTDALFGLDVGWPVLFGIAFVEFFILATVISVHVWLRKQRTTTGVEGMIGEKATVIEWNGQKGSLRFEGEIWKATSENEMDLNKDDEVTILKVNKMNLIISA